MGEKSSHRDPHLRPVGAIAVLVAVLGCGEGVPQLFTHGLGRHRAVALDMGEIPVTGREQGALGEHHAELEGDRFHPALTAEQRVDEGVGHQRGVPLAGALGAAALSLEGEAFVGELGVERRQMRAHGRHAVLCRGEPDMPFPARGLVAARGAVRVELADGGGRRGAPGLHAGAVHAWKLLVQHLVDLAALQVVEGFHRRGGGISDSRCHGAARERGEHPRHRGDESPRGGQAAARGRGRAFRGEGEIPRGPRIGLAVEPLERREKAVLVGGPVAHGADVVASSRLREGDDGARLEGVEGAARAVDHVEQVLVLRALMPGAVEHRLGGGGDRGEKEADVAQQLCERGGAPGVERSQELLGSGMLRRGC
ncbi:hypothetical protein FM106_23455 [Brachybacterium faecium]|nr:hypothetical protein FM106_23455 [Brachybacterium faecium]